MGDFQKHLELAKEKFQAAINAYNNKQSTVVGDMGTKVVEQLVEADAANRGNILAIIKAGMNTQTRISLLK